MIIISNIVLVDTKLDSVSTKTIFEMRLWKKSKLNYRFLK